MHNVHVKSQRKKRPVIGVLVEDVQGYWCNVLTGANDCAHEHDVNVIFYSGGILCDTRQNFQAQRNIIYALISEEHLDGFVFAALIILLLFRPNGILGSTEREKI